MTAQQRAGDVAGAGRGVALVVVSAVAFGTLGVFGKLAPREGLTLPTFLALRFGIAAVVLGALLAARRGVRRPSARTAASVAFMGVLYAGQALCYFGSLRTVPAAVTSILLYTYPVIVTVLARVIFRERLTLPRTAALLAAAFGVLLVVDPFGTRSLDPAGVLLGLGSAAVYSTYILSGTVVLRSVAPLPATAGIAAVAAVILAIAGAMSGQLRPFAAGGWPVILATAAIPTVLAATAFLAGLRLVGPAVASTLSTLEPASTALLAALVLGETLSAVRWIGGAITLAAAALLARATAAQGRAQREVAPVEA